MVIDRAKSNEEIPNRIDTLANEFQGLGENKELANEREEEEEGIPGLLEEGDPFCEREMGIPRKEERPRMKRRERATPWDIEMDLSGGIIKTKYVKIEGRGY